MSVMNIESLGVYNKEIDIKEVRAGDVLLSYGSGYISDLIRLIDGGIYSHAALYDGNIIVEAGLREVVETPLETELKAQKYVDIYRFKSDSGNYFSIPDWPVSPVIDKAHNYLDKGTKYANNQLYLIGVLIILRKLPHKRIEKIVLRSVLDQVFKLLKGIVKGKEVKSVVCSEFVYRSFYEATKDRKYGLTITDTLTPITTNIENHIDEDIVNKINEIEKMYLDINKNDMNLDVNLFGKGNPLVASEMVSPNDLSLSPNLELIGRLKK